jgi:DNA-binding MarR family transcriptional regulator
MLVELVRIGEKANEVLEFRLTNILSGELSATERAIHGGVGFNLTKAVLLLAIHKPLVAECTPSSIGKQTQLSRSRVSRQIQDMLLYGWVQHVPGKGKREKLELTLKGRSMAVTIERSVGYINGQLRKGLAKELDQFQKSTLIRIGDRLESLEACMKMPKRNPNRQYTASLRTGSAFNS